MTSYANEGIPEVETPHCRISVQVRLPRRTHVQYGDHTQYSLAVVVYLTAIVQFWVAIFYMQIRTIPEVKRFVNPSFARHSL